MTTKRSAIPAWPNQKITIYTDGSCIGNPGVGGWAYVLQVYSDDTLKMQTIKAGQLPETTNNKAELQAITNAIGACPSGIPIKLFTDSEYCQKGCMIWLKGWKAKGYRKGDKKPIANKKMWMKLDGLLTEKTPEVIHVKAHVGIELNEIADGRARDAAEYGITIDAVKYFDDEGNSIDTPATSQDKQE